MMSMPRRFIILSFALLLLAGCGNFFSDEPDNGGNPDTPRFAYVVNTNNLGPGTISIFSVNETSGALTAAGSVSTPAGGPQSAVIVLGRFLYVGSNGGGVSGFTINESTGALTAISGSPFVAGNAPLAVAADTQGKFLYAANFLDNSISAFSIDANTGVLSPLASVPVVALPASPQDIKVDVSNRYLFVAMPSALSLTGSISAFRLDPSTGELSARQDFAATAGGHPNSLALEQTGRFLYVVDALPGVEPWQINDPTAGAFLTALDLPSSPSGANPGSAVADTSGSFLYVGNRDSNDISAYVILSSGRLSSSVSGSPFATDSIPQTLAFDPTGKFLYVAHNSGSIKIFSIAPDTGVISATANTASAGSDPRNIVFK
jgi:6-phosphogluconolactonase